MISTKPVYIVENGTFQNISIVTLNTSESPLLITLWNHHLNGFSLILTIIGAIQIRFTMPNIPNVNDKY